MTARRGAPRLLSDGSFSGPRRASRGGPRGRRPRSARPPAPTPRSAGASSTRPSGRSAGAASTRPASPRSRPTAKVAEGTVYLYFRNKEDLLGVVFDESMDDVLAKGRALGALEGAGRPSGSRRSSTSTSSSSARTATSRPSSRSSSGGAPGSSSASRAASSSSTSGSSATSCATGSRAASSARDLDPRLAVRILFGAADEILSEWLLSGETKPIADAKQLVGTLLRGFAAPRETTPSKSEREGTPPQGGRPSEQSRIHRSTAPGRRSRAPGTDFTDVSAVDLGRAAAVEAMARAGVEPAAIDQAIFGNIATPVDAANIARIIALRAGVPKEKPAHSVSRNCASGIESVVQAARLIATGEADVVLAGGVENMTQIPFLYRDGVKEVFTKAGMAKTRGPARVGASRRCRGRTSSTRSSASRQGLTDPVCDLNMGETAEILAKEGRITREAQDALRAALAPAGAPRPARSWPRRSSRCPSRRTTTASLTFDNGVRENQTMEALAKLKPFFDRKFGTVTAGQLVPDHGRRRGRRRRLGGVRREARR